MASETDAAPRTRRRRETDACCPRPDVAPALDRLDLPHATHLADRLKALADPTRLSILALLVAHPEALCVCEITERFPLQQPTISHHLRLLRAAAFISGERRGVWAYYSATELGRRSLALVELLQ